MSFPTVIAIALGAAIVGALLGFMLNRRRREAEEGSAQEQADQLLSSASTEAESLRRNAALEAKELLLAAKTEAEANARERTAQLEEQRKELVKQEEEIQDREDQLGRREKDLARKEKDLDRREQSTEASAKSATEMLEKAKTRLEELAQLTPEQAREQLIEQISAEARRAAAKEIKRIEDETAAVAKERSTTIIASAIQRYASEYVGERTVAVVQLPNDDMKGRIIGREGRNIRALEAATGVDLIIDDTPEAVILSCFNPVRREVGRLALTRLIADGRIHPSRIEDVVRRSKDDVQASCKEAGEQAVFDLGLHRVHPELVRLLGELQYRSSYAQNLLAHSVEVGYVSGLLASELGLGIKQARRAGLLHDIGKALAHEVEGSHASVGASLAKKYGESPKVSHAIAAHHGEVEAKSVLAHIVDAANQLSARRPGARRERLASFVQRLQDLETLCKAQDGVERAYAIQAGREVRVIVEQDKVDDAMATILSKDLARKVENELTYPGQIKICVIRESRASDTAR
ncbi:MAG: ribonuclease Y [Proteobacteria bacterium]|nr:MAG: ribonuclease Y [Pseudomonadota bacterium]PIE19040.1 MAG: ribonuclease Y [Pseudomonadota bacterium]